MPTMEGTDAWTPYAAKADGDFARMYLATGLIPLGKTQLSEYGFSASSEHPGSDRSETPWHTERTAGASSAGSAALVAAGAVPIAHANDGGGSIRIPAAVNGLVGLKPSRGRLAQDASMRQMPIKIVADGVVTRSVRDTAAFFREAERVYRPLKMPPIGDLTRPGRKRLRVAMNTTGLSRGADAEVTALTEQTARLLEDLGHTVVEVDAPAPATFGDDFLLYWAASPWPWSAAAAGSTARPGCPATTTRSPWVSPATRAATSTGSPARCCGCAAAPATRPSSSRSTTSA